MDPLHKDAVTVHPNSLDRRIADVESDSGLKMPGRLRLREALGELIAKLLSTDHYEKAASSRRISGAADCLFTL